MSAFNEMFDTAKTTDNKIIQPNFKGQWVVGTALKATDKVVTITFEKAEILGKAMNVYLTVRDESTLSSKILPLALATVPRSGNVKAIHFILNGRDVQTIPVL